MTAFVNKQAPPLLPYFLQYYSLIPGCPKETRLTEYSGTFSSPNHKDLYPDNQECTWVIKAPHASLHVKLTFSSFHLEDCKHCACDSVTIYDVKDDKRNVTIGKFCGVKNPGTFYSSGQYMIVVFKSDNGDSHSGFLAHYQSNIQQGSGNELNSRNLTYKKQNNTRNWETVGSVSRKSFIMGLVTFN